MGELTATEAVRNAFRRIEVIDPALNCFCAVYSEDALREAEEVDRRVAAEGAASLMATRL